MSVSTELPIRQDDSTIHIIMQRSMPDRQTLLLSQMLSVATANWRQTSYTKSDFLPNALECHEGIPLSNAAT